jgi:hypothetical protein
MQGLTIITKTISLALFQGLALFLFYATFFKLNNGKRLFKKINNNNLQLLMSLPLNIIFTLLAHKTLVPLEGNLIIFVAGGFLASFVFVLFQFLFYMKNTDEENNMQIEILKFSIFCSVSFVFMNIASLPARKIIAETIAGTDIYKLLAAVLIFYLSLLFTSEILIKLKRNTDTC